MTMSVESADATAAIAIVLQLCDSSFPSGAFNCSWGLEGLVADGTIAHGTDLCGLVVEQLRHRWATFDRVVAHLVVTALDRPHPDLAATIDAIVAVDRRVEAMSLPPAQREASRDTGRTFLRSAASVVGGEPAEHLAALEALDAPMHLAVTLPLVLRVVGASMRVIDVVSGLQLVQQLASAGLRLGVVGHVGAQSVVARGREELGVLLAEPPGTVLSQFVPRAEVAMYRQPRLVGRSFRC